MYIAAIGGLELKSWRHGPEFAWRTSAVLRQARAAGDCLHADVFPRGKVYFSLTLWRNAAALKRFARSGAHLGAWRVAKRLSTPLHFHHFACEVLPSSEEAYRLWKSATPLPRAGGF